MGKKRIFLIVSFLFLISLISFISAQPPFAQTGTFTEGYEIKYPPFSTFKQNTDVTLNFHVFNITNGVPIDNSSTNCYLHIYLSQGTQEYETEVSHSNTNVINEWEINVDKGNFTASGDGAYVIQCNSTILGGFESVSFEITKSGKTISFNLFLPLVVILFFSMLCFIFGVTSKENKIMKYTLFSLAVVMAYVGIQYTLIVVQDYSLIGETEGGLGFFLTFFQAITWIIGGIFTLVIIWLFLQLRKWFNIKKGFMDGGNYR